MADKAYGVSYVTIDGKKTKPENMFGYCKAHKGTKLVVQSHLQNDNFTNKEGVKVYRDTLVVDSVEFAESKAASEKANKSEQSPASPTSDGFMDIPDAIDEEVPFR
jgi:single-strand DNA-binding protein